MNSILRPHLGFATSEVERSRVAGEVDESLTEKLSRVGVEAARRKFTPEFMNRIDKVVVFRPLGTEQLEKILGSRAGDHSSKELFVRRVPCPSS